MPDPATTNRSQVSQIGNRAGLAVPGIRRIATETLIGQRQMLGACLPGWRSVDPRRRPRGHKAISIRLAASAAAVVLMLVGCGGSEIAKTDPIALASQIGAQACDDSGFYVENRLDKSKSEIYDCSKNGKPICVDVEGGTPRDVTQEAKLIYANALDSSNEPSCVTSG